MEKLNINFFHLFALALCLLQSKVKQTKIDFFCNAYMQLARVHNI